MNLDEAQKKMVAGWIEEGLKLSEIQSKLASELGVQVTYMEVRFLVDDLKLMPKDKEVPPPEKIIAAPAAEEPLPGTAPEPDATPQGTGTVSVVVDAVARPGTMVSGNVTFSDGNSAVWYLDETGRLGLAPAQKGYKPTQQDVQAFQTALQNEMQKIGF